MMTQFALPGRELGPLETDWDGTSGITDWGMDGNDQWSCCGGSATDHGNMAKVGNVSQLDQLGRPKFAGTLPTYWAYGLAMGETGTPPHDPSQPDQGVDNRTWLGFLFENEIIDGYGEIPVDQIGRYAAQGVGVLLGVSLSDNAEQEFEAVPPIPWGSAGDTPDPNEGHDVWLIKYHPADGSGAVITWGKVQPFDPAFHGNIRDAWVIFDEEDADRVGYNWPAIQTVLTEIHGTSRATTLPTPPETAAADLASPIVPGFFEKIEDLVDRDVTTVVRDVDTWYRHGGDVANPPQRP
jgi:hypothetical protein